MTVSRLAISGLSTGVQGLDAVLGGSLPDFSFNLLVGEPGTGKTTLAHQILFKNATEERPGLYFSVLGEPPIKMLRYQQQFEFFDQSKVGRAVHFVNLSEAALTRRVEAVLDAVVAETERLRPGLVVVDSFRTVTPVAGEAPASELQDFTHRLALFLASREATTFLVGEYSEQEPPDNPLFTVADGILWLTNALHRHSSVRKLRVAKMRGRAPLSGAHTFRISSQGLQVFPRAGVLPAAGMRRVESTRASTGVAALDAMMSGGIPRGDLVLVSGPSGSGKTALSTQFIGAGGARGEPGVIAAFEEHPDVYLDRAKGLGDDLRGMTERGLLEVIYLRPLDLSVDETLYEIHRAVKEKGARRLVIDSLSGFEISLAAPFREDFRESLYRLVGALTATGVTILLTAEVAEDFTSLEISPQVVSFLTDVIIVQRYIELEGHLRRMMTVVKMRNSEHSSELRLYELGPHGVTLGPVPRGYRRLLTGVPERPGPARVEGLTTREAALLDALREAGPSPATQLKRAMGLPSPLMAQSLERLLALGYVEKGKGRARGAPVYRAIRQDS
ncbi:MAG: AAA family ATPase [Deltaproteobacteria bacterium]|nr:AAA family ATPase [Deltaproteobacteria bacterium]